MKNNQGLKSLEERAGNKKEELLKRTEIKKKQLMMTYLLKKIPGEEQNKIEQEDRKASAQGDTGNLWKS